MIRLGRISYVNMAPVFFRLDVDVEEVPGVPTELNARLLAGEIDLAPISSIEYARNADRAADPSAPLRLLGGRGRLDPARLARAARAGRLRRGDARERDLGRADAGSCCPTPSTCRSAKKADATLLIGDAALRSAFEDPTPHYDLGRLWLERTGLPMVFAVWACPEPAPAGRAASSRRRSSPPCATPASEPERLACEASERYGYPAGFLARYFEKLRYSFGPRERAGLITFFELARDVGELDARSRARFVAPEAVSA